MVVALTARQWRSLLDATGTQESARALEESLGVDLLEEGARYRARAAIVAMLAPWFAQRDFGQVSEALERDADRAEQDADQYWSLTHETVGELCDAHAAAMRRVKTRFEKTDEK